MRELGNEYLITFPDAQLHVFVEADQDLDADFVALCCDTDKLLLIEGYNALDIELLN